MKRLFFTMLFLSTNVMANPTTIWCDKRSLFSGLTRVKLERVSTLEYDLVVYKEEKCSKKCSALKPILKQTVILFESPDSRELMVTPDFDRSGDDVWIYTESRLCSIELASGYKFKGKVVRAD